MPDNKIALKIIDGQSNTQSLAAITDSVGTASFHALTGVVAHDISSSLYYTQSAAQSLYELSGTLNKISQSVASGSVYNSTGSAQYLSIISGNVKDYTTALQNISSSVSSSLNINGTSSAKLLQDISSSLGVSATDYRPFITNSIDNQPIGNLLYRISQSLTYATNTSSATLLADISSSVADIRDAAGQDYSIYLTSSTGNKTVANLLYDISASSAYSDTGSAKYLSYISEAVASIRDGGAQDYSTVLTNISNSLNYNSKSTARYLSDLSSSVSSSLFGTEGNLYTSGKSAAGYLSDISSSLSKISQSLAVGEDTVLNQISASLKAIDIDTTNISSSIVTTNTKLDTIAGHVDGIEGYVDGIETKLTDISSSVTYISQSTLGYATNSVITRLSGSDFSSGIYTIPSDSSRVSLQILSKVNNKLIYVSIANSSPTLSPPLYSYEMTPSGSYYAFDCDVRLSHTILTGSTAFAADDYVLVTQTKK